MKTRCLCRQMNEIRRSWVRGVLDMSCLVTDAAFELEVVKCATFIPYYKNQIILHINIDFHYKNMYNYHQLVSLLFSLHDCMSLNQNND